MDLGATVCRPATPLSAKLVPVERFCAAFAGGDPAGYPRRKAKAERPHRHGVAWLMTSGGTGRSRPPTGQGAAGRHARPADYRNGVGRPGARPPPSPQPQRPPHGATWATSRTSSPTSPSRSACTKLTTFAGRTGRYGRRARRPWRVCRRCFARRSRSAGLLSSERAVGMRGGAPHQSLPRFLYWARWALVICTHSRRLGRAQGWVFLAFEEGPVRGAVSESCASAPHRGRPSPAPRARRIPARWCGHSRRTGSRRPGPSISSNVAARPSSLSQRPSSRIPGVSSSRPPPGNRISSRWEVV